MSLRFLILVNNVFRRKSTEPSEQTCRKTKDVGEARGANPR